MKETPSLRELAKEVKQVVTVLDHWATIVYPVNPQLGKTLHDQAEKLVDVKQKLLGEK